MKTLQQIRIEEQKEKVKEWYEEKSFDYKESHDLLDFDELMYNVESLVMSEFERECFVCSNDKLYVNNEEWIRLLYPGAKHFRLNIHEYISINEDTDEYLRCYLKSRICILLDSVSEYVEVINNLSRKSKLG